MTERSSFRWRTWIFLTVFIYTLLLGLFVQLVFLPHIAPSMHMGEGVLSSNHDTYTFHYYAKKLAEVIRENGWSNWEWRVGSSPVSSLTAIFYVFFGPHFWLMMPYNALVHALSAVVLFDLFKSLLPKLSSRVCLIGTIPFVLFPSTLVWTTQLHKDGLFFLAVFMLFWVVVRMLRSDEYPLNRAYSIRLLGICWLGMFFIWWFREDRLVLFEIFLGLCLIPTLRNWVVSRTLNNSQRLASVGLLVSMLLGGWLLMQYHVKPTITSKTRDAEEQAQIKEDNPQLEAWSRDKWQPVKWLPAKVDAKLAQLTEVRNNYFLIHHTGNSTIDPEQSFTSAYDIIAYVPRMVQLSFFAPFPKDWLDKGSTTSLSVMKLIVSMETVLVYLSFIGMFYILAKHWRNPTLWYLLFMTAVFIMIYTFVFPNLGTFYRQRFGFLSIITGLGFIGLAQLILRRREKRLTLGMTSSESALDSE